MKMRITRVELLRKQNTYRRVTIMGMPFVAVASYMYKTILIMLLCYSVLLVVFADRICFRRFPLPVYGIPIFRSIDLNTFCWYCTA